VEQKLKIQHQYGHVLILLWHYDFWDPDFS